MPSQNFDVYLRFLVEQSQAQQSLAPLEEGMRQFNEQIEEAKKNARELRSISRDLGQISREAFLIGATITGGIFAAANKYVKDAKEATAVTEKWKAAQDSLSKSGTRVGAVLAEQALPLLQKAATLADKAAGFVEKHPEIVSAALNAGLVLAALGAVGTAVSKGIRLVADIQYLAAVAQEQIGINKFVAAVLQFYAGVQEYAGATGIKGAGGLAGGAGGLAGGGGIAGFLKYAAVTVAALIAGGVIGDAVGDAIAKKTEGENAKNYTGKDYLTEAKQILAISAAGWGKVFGGAELSNKWFRSVSEGLGLMADKAQEAADALKSLNAVNSAYQDYIKADQQTIAKYKEDREQVISDTKKSLADSAARYANEIASATTSHQNQISSLMANFAQENQQAEIQYNTERASIVQQGGLEIQRIEQQHQEDMLKLQQAHEDRVRDLVASRDALGLVKENEAYARERKQAEADTNKQIAQRRQDLAIQLRDLAQNYEQQRQQRQAQYQQQIEEAKAQYQQQLQQAAQAYADEQKQIHEQEAQKLAELDRNLQVEHQKNRQAFIENINDLSKSLSDQRTLRLQYQNLMIQDEQRFWQQVRGSIPTASSIPATAGGGTSTASVVPNPTTTASSTISPWLLWLGQHDYSGYAYKGAYAMAQNGIPEYVLSGQGTQAAERLIGGKLNQETILSALAMMSGGRSVQYNDSRRFNASIPASERRRIQDETIDMITESLT